MKMPGRNAHPKHLCRRMPMQVFARVCIALGVVLMAVTLVWYGWYRREDTRAATRAQTTVGELREQTALREEPETQEQPSPAEEQSQAEPDASLSTELPVVEIDGYEYIGYLSIPAIDIDLPVMGEWSYPKLKIAPCRQFGSSRTDDLVIAAHNYASHFGRIGTLSYGDTVSFTDMDGIQNLYRVRKISVLEPTAVEEVEHSGSALVLYTCTWGGKNRIVVFCERTS